MTYKKMMTPEMTRQRMHELSICVVMPTYNNAGTLQQVVSEVRQYCDTVLVVNDGSTDATSTVLSAFDGDVQVVSYPTNKGKGHALRTGFSKAIELGFHYAITIDSDGQHYPTDIPQFVEAIDRHPDCFIVGNRNLESENMPGKNTFANRFSNFWFHLQTGINLPDTQTGFRLYDLTQLHGLSLLTSRYEAELELLVFAAWNGVKIHSLPIHVYYPPAEERVSHFRPAYDFTRISILNTILCFGALLYGLPKAIVRKITRR